jgi:hypothetical protein
MPRPRPFQVLRALGVAALVVLLLMGCDGAAAPSSAAAGRPSGSAASPTPPRAAASPTDFLQAAARGAWRPRALEPGDILLRRLEMACATAEPAADRLPVVLREVRGEGRATVIFGEADGDGPAFLCGGTLDATTEAEVDLVTLDAGPEPIPEEGIDIVRYEVVVDGSGDSRTVLVGRVGRAALRVLALFPDESEVEGIKGGGWYAMWWPGSVPTDVVAAVDRRHVVIGDIAPSTPPSMR